MKNKLWIVVVIAVVVAVLAWAFIPKQSANSGKPTIKIGMMLPMTGNMAVLGKPALKTAKTAVNDINNKSGNKFYYELVSYDDQMDPKVSNTIAQKLIHIDKVNAVVGYSSTQARVVAPLAAQNKIINMNIAFAKDILNSKYNFITKPTTDDEVAGIIKFLRLKGAKKIDLLFDNIAAAEDILATLTPELKKLGIKFHIEQLNMGERDIAPVVRKIKDSDSDIVVVYLFNPHMDMFGKEAARQNLSKTIVFADTMPLSNNKELFNGMYNVGELGLSEEFVKHLGLTDKDNTANIYIVYGTFMIIADAFERAGTTDADEVVAKIYEQGKFNISGIEYTLDKIGWFHSPVEITTIKNGKSEVVK
jgi:ABC-type branched-subunit amino acid transport system substrate-binding protein